VPVYPIHLAVSTVDILLEYSATAKRNAIQGNWRQSCPPRQRRPYLLAPPTGRRKRLLLPRYSGPPASRRLSWKTRRGFITVVATALRAPPEWRRGIIAARSSLLPVARDWEGQACRHRDLFPLLPCFAGRFSPHIQQVVGNFECQSQVRSNSCSARCLHGVARDERPLGAATEEQAPVFAIVNGISALARSRMPLPATVRRTDLPREPSPSGFGTWHNRRGNVSRAELAIEHFEGQCHSASPARSAMPSPNTLCNVVPAAPRNHPHPSIDGRSSWINGVGVIISTAQIAGARWLCPNLPQASAARSRAWSEPVCPLHEHAVVGFDLFGSFSLAFRG